MVAPKKTKTVVGKTVKSQVNNETKSEENVKSENLFDQLISRFKTFDRESNIHMIVGVLLLLIGLYLLRSWIVGLIFLILGILFVTGYFEKK